MTYGDAIEFLINTGNAYKAIIDLSQYADTPQRQGVQNQRGGTMKPDEAIKLIERARFGKFPYSVLTIEAFDLAISALKKQEQSCETCKHGRFGDEACINCRVGFPSHYEAEEES